MTRRIGGLLAGRGEVGGLRACIDAGDGVGTWRATSPNICASARVVHGGLPDAALAAAGEANRSLPDEQRLLDALVRDAIGAAKYLARGRRWEAAAAVERMRRSLLELRGRRDNLRLDPADPAGALAETQAGYDLGPARRALLDRIDPAPDA